MRRIWVYLAVTAAALAAVVTIAVLSADTTPTPQPPGATVNPVPVAPSATAGEAGEVGERLPLEHGGVEDECDSVDNAFAPDEAHWALTATAAEFAHEWFNINHDGADTHRDERLAPWMADGADTSTWVVEFAHGQVGMVTTATTIGEAVALPWPTATHRAVRVTVNIEVTYTAPEQGATQYRGAAAATVHFDDTNAVTAVTEVIRWLPRP